MTARQCKERLNLDDMNMVRPRITELCELPYDMLEVKGEAVDTKTKVKVSVFGIKNHEPVQMGLAI